MSAIDMQHHLKQLQAERALASIEGLGDNRPYMANLNEEIAETTAAYVGAVVSEIATLRGELSGRLLG
jgi:hypothetical protein